MFPRIVASLALALTLAAAPALAEPSPRPNASPIPSPSRPLTGQQQEEVAAAFLAWLQPITVELERAGRAMAPFLQMEFIGDEKDPEAALAAVREVSRHAVAGRAELALARERLAAMAPFAHPNAPPEMLRLAAMILRDSRESAVRMDQLLNDMILFAGAVERGDTAEVERLSPQIERSSTLLIQSQATMLRARQQLVPADTSPYHAMGGMVAMYDGLVALLASDADFDAAAVEAAAVALDASLAAERAAILRERASLRRSDPDYAVAVEVMEARAAFADVNERARNELRTAAQAARAGSSTTRSRDAHVVVLAELEYEYQRIARRQLELHARLVR